MGDAFGPLGRFGATHGSSSRPVAPWLLSQPPPKAQAARDAGLKPALSEKFCRQNSVAKALSIKFCRQNSVAKVLSPLRGWEIFLVLFPGLHLPFAALRVSLSWANFLRSLRELFGLNGLRAKAEFRIGY